MTRFRALSPLAALLAAASFSIPAQAAPATAPSALFHRLRPVQPRGRDRSPDQPRRTHHRLCPQLQRHHDRQGAADHLAGRRRERSAAAARGRLGLLFVAALVARRNPPGLCRRGGRKSATLRPLDGKRGKRAHHRPSRQPGHDRLVSRRPAHRLFDVHSGRGHDARLRPAQARGRQVGRPAPIHQRRHLPLRWRRLFQARLYADLLGARRRRLAGAADVWRDQRRRRPDRLDSRQPLGAVQRQPQQELGTRAQRERDLSRQHRWRSAGCADHPEGARRVARRVARRAPDRLCRRRRRRPLVSRIPSCR